MINARDQNQYKQNWRKFHEYGSTKDTVFTGKPKKNRIMVACILRYYRTTSRTVLKNKFSLCTFIWLFQQYNDKINVRNRNNVISKTLTNNILAILQKVVITFISPKVISKTEGPWGRWHTWRTKPCLQSNEIAKTD